MRVSITKRQSFRKLVTDSRVYAGVYDSIINGQPKLVKDEETLLQVKMLETGIQQCRH